MANYWIVKTEPSTYGWRDLEREGTTRWDGVRNNLALKHIRAMRTGDSVFIYHSGKEKAVVGEARVVSDPYPDPEAGDEKLVVVDVEVGEALRTPVPLATIKQDGAFEDLALVRMPRLSVMPATATQWKRLRKLGAG
ncbi:MAG: EVE domain-containing protein [Gemmatimonadales bacterium]